MSHYPGFSIFHPYRKALNITGCPHRREIKKNRLNILHLYPVGLDILSQSLTQEQEKQSEEGEPSRDIAEKGMVFWHSLLFKYSKGFGAGANLFHHIKRS